MLVVLAILTGCAVYTTTFSTTTCYNKTFSISQVDSIMTAEGVFELDSLAVRGLSDSYYEYYFLKDSLVIRFIKNEDSILVTKRINKR